MSEWRSHYRGPDPNNWQGKMDNITYSVRENLPPQRLHEIIQCVDLTNLKTFNDANTAIIGFCSDLGVRRNQGRPGAAEAPHQIRKQLANKALHNQFLKIYDVGDVVLNSTHVIDEHEPCVHDSIVTNQKGLFDPLKNAQALLAQKVSKLLRENLFTIILGGGHEVAKPHYDALCEVHPHKKIGIINIDAHFDLRQDLSAPTSGTSFFEIWQQTKKSVNTSFCQDFHYLVIGIQPSSNTPLLYSTAVESNTIFIEADNIPYSGPNEEQCKLVKSFTDQVDVIMLTLCMDVFQSAISPGVSAPSPNGLTPHQVFRLLNEIMKSEKIYSIDIAETNPSTDVNFNTTALAAEICYRLLPRSEQA